MPILYVHGVNTRSREGFLALDGYLRRHVAPAISNRPDTVLIDDVFWGNAGVDFAWDGVCRPRSRILGMGPGATELSAVEGALTAAAYAEALDRVPEPSAAAPSIGGLIAGGARPSGPTQAGVRPRELSQDELADLLAVTIASQVPQSAEQTRLILAADDVARDPATSALLGGAATAEDELDALFDEVRRRAESDATLVAAGFASSLAKVRDTLKEGFGRALGLPAYAVSVVAAEMRKPLNDLISVFLGDVFAYLDDRGKAPVPGEIPRRMLAKLRDAHENKTKRDGEALVVLSHSMGGQIVYDAVTHFLPNMPGFEDIRIDFWCATASQVGFFEETKLFIAQSPEYKTGNPVPFPADNLGIWWNVWDHNDFISFSGKGIFSGIDDEAFDSGMSLLGAHGGYLKRPSFFRKFAEKLEAGKAKGWTTS
jgi:hypothetical protein